MNLDVQVVNWKEEKESLYAIRKSVFIEEQGVPEEIEVDDWDEISMHVLAFSSEQVAIGCARLLPDGHIGRMAVLKDWRGKGVGTAILCKLVEEAEKRSISKILLNAQKQAVPFYEREGFCVYGEPFEEAGIPHVRMQRITA